MSPTPSRLSRLPLRRRLVAGFSAATFVVLLAAGGFVYWQFDRALDNGLDTELIQAAQVIGPLVRGDGQVSNQSAAEATGVAWQVLNASGVVLDYGGAAGIKAMVGRSQLDRVGSTFHTFNVGDFLPVADEPYRLRVIRLTPGVASAPHLYLLVGARRDQRDDALRELLVQLALAGLGVLVVTALVGERLARAALRPVERYRRRAAAIAAGASDLRLDVPAQRDDEVTRLGHTLNDMLESLERALVRERQFVNEASHELRTPITLLTSRIQLARSRPRSQAEHERVLEELQVDLDRLARLAEQLLNLGSATGRAGDQTCDLAEVTTRVVAARQAADQAAGQISVEVPAEAVAVALGDFEVERILANLLSNAASHGAAPTRVTVERPLPGWARLCVTDAGPGLTADLLETAPRRFARAESARSRPGAGLGLALVEAITTQAGGELRLCFDDHHASHGHRARVDCNHSRAMTVTVLLPTVSHAGETNAGL